MDAVKNDDRVSRSSTWAGWLFILGTMLVGFTLWQQHKEWEQKIDAANGDVKANIGVYLPQAFAAWSDTIQSDKPLVPDAIYSGKNSTIIAIQASNDYTRLWKDRAVWDVLARSTGGTYFSLRYYLCDDCDPDSNNLKSHRIFTLHNAIDFRALSVNEAKDWLYRAGMRKEFKTEFGTDPPPISVEG